MMGLIMRPIRLKHLLFINLVTLQRPSKDHRRNLTNGFSSEETMRLHSTIALRSFFTRKSLRSFFTRKSLRIPQNLSITSSPVATNLLGVLSSRLGSPSPSPNSISSSSVVFQIPNASFKFSHENQRRYGTDSSGDGDGGGSPPDVNKVVDEINLKFAEAREEIEMAMDAKETVYFNEEAECARTAVAEVLDMFEGLLGKVTEKERASLQRSMGLKIEQLKAELQQLNE